MPSAVDFDVNDDPGALRGMRVHAPYILYAGSYEPRKNLVGMLLAYQRYTSTGGTLPLLAVTEAESGHARTVHEVLRGLACRDRVRLVHDVSQQNLRALYSAAAAVVFPSLAEGLGLPPIQAAACGVPIVVSDLPVLKETVGAIATLADPSDATSLCQAIVRATSDPAVRDKCAREGPSIAAQFHPRRCATAHADIYRACTEHRGAPV